ncbi:RraA family protein [Ammoniphilus resinae]|uniref:Putative 4-hydroxy-4-methyl-2-oxoglutarate aldolase n=1 Tax=Ammoniphilus resinae TaxID=861532 RepID=A0ABS4GW03_9BACL|nr:RraA family protein [Ammoniphilus resinae]MBP1934453.1 regulator of RNase E activity RraA [Ammoniphilus resinae]
MTTIAIPLEEMIERFSKIYTGAISDALDLLGFHDQVLPKELKGLTADAKLCGTALTVRGEATHSEDPEVVFVPMLKMLGDVQKHNIVISQPNDDTCSHLGELSATTIKARGGVGAVIYGGVRDVDYIQKLGLPVFHLYTTPADIMGRWCLKEYNVPIRIQNVSIHPDDIIVGDKDGVLVVPKDAAQDVLLRAEELVATENHVRNDVQNGIHPLDSYYKHGWF